MKGTGAKRDEAMQGLPKPSATFRRRAWRQFQRELDPLAQPRPLPMPERRRER
jgi:hypothetical protein